MRTKERITSILLMLLFGFAFWYCGRFPKVPKVMPQLVSSVGFVLCLGLFIKTFVFKYSDDDRAPIKFEPRTVGLLTASIAALCAYAGLITTVGYYTVSFVFIIVMSLIVDRKRPIWQYPTIAVGALLIIWLIFSKFLSIPLPKGMFF